MPEPLTKEEVEKGQDPSVTKQWDNDVSAEKKFEDFYAIVDKQKIGMLGTYRDGIGPAHHPPTTSFAVFFHDLFNW
ncbi:hypothetical protein KC355_g2787 [Hortaea werneckii]|nr:hypothetical protein KC355_g2787 [Hortaea werneckii]